VGEAANADQSTEGPRCQPRPPEGRARQGEQRACACPCWPSWPSPPPRKAAASRPLKRSRPAPFRSVLLNFD
jgi:hypothetical protein